MAQELKAVLAGISSLDAPALGIILAETEIAIRLEEAHKAKQGGEARESGDAE